MILSNECWLGYHPDCSVPENCGCLCHMTTEEALRELVD